MPSKLTTTANRQLQRGNYQVFPELRLLLRGGEKIDLSGKPFDIALLLIEANNSVVAKDELLRRVWPDQIVEENNLQAHISAIRRALGPDRGLLKTEFGNGYRLELPADSVQETQEADAPQFQIPATTTPLFGRHEELIKLGRMIESSVLVTITGTGGIGKTRLATELANRSQDAFDRILFVELASFTSADLVLPTLAAKVTVDQGSLTGIAPQEPKPRTLLILDGCEHLLQSVADAVGSLLRQASTLAIVTTSQEPLHIDGEQVFRLQPLDVPKEEASILDQALEYASVQLLLSRIRSIDHDFSVTGDNVSGLCSVCRQLDGIPLALELAASRIPLLGLQEVVSGLSDRFKLLTAGRRSAMPRHQTLRATLDWSYELLSPSEQRLLHRLGIFAGPFTLASVSAVTADDEDSQHSSIDMISSLVAKSLVSRDTASHHRFYLFESMRAFAMEKLVLTRELSTVASRHSDFFRNRLRTATSDWKNMPLGKWLAEYKDDLNDVRAALDSILSDTEAAARSAELICDSLPFWMQLSLLDECRVRVTNVLHSLEKYGKKDASLEMRLQRALGSALAWSQGPTRKVEDAWLRTLDLSRQNHDVEHQMQSHYGLWLYYLRTGHYRRALAHGEDLTSLARLADDKMAFWTGERAKGVALHFLGQNEAARKLIEDALAGHDYSPNRSFPLRFGVDQRVAGFAFLARILWLLGDRQSADAVAEAAISEAEELDHVSSLCCALLEGGCSLWVLSEQWERVQQAATRALTVADRHNLGFWRAYADAFRTLAEAELNLSHDTLRELSTATSTLLRIDVNPGYSSFLLGAAKLHARMGKFDQANEVINNLMKIVGETDYWALPELKKLKAQFEARKIALH